MFLCVSVFVEMPQRHQQTANRQVTSTKFMKGVVVVNENSTLSNKTKQRGEALKKKKVVGVLTSIAETTRRVHGVQGRRKKNNVS